MLPISGALDTSEESEIREAGVPEAPAKNISPVPKPVVDAPGIDEPHPPSKEKKKLAYKLRKKIVGEPRKCQLLRLRKSLLHNT